MVKGHVHAGVHQTQIRWRDQMTHLLCGMHSESSNKGCAVLARCLMKAVIVTTVIINL